MKSIVFISFLFVTHFLIAQSTLKFSEVSHDTVQQKEEIISAIETFNFNDVSMTLNMKHLEDENGRIVRVYWKKGHLWKVSWVTEWAANGTRNVLFDSNENIKLIIDEAHGSSWARENFIYLNDRHFYTYAVSGNIEYDSKGIGKVSYKNQLKEKMRLVEKSVTESEYVEGLNLDSIKAKALDYYNKALSTSDQFEKGKYLFEGTIGWKVAFQMKWKVNKKGKIKGEIIYLSDKQTNDISGQITEERFTIKVTDDNHTAEGRIIGRIISTEELRGQLFIDSAEKGDFFEMKIIEEKE